MGLFDKVSKTLNETAAKVTEATKNVKPEDIQKGFSKIADEAGKATKAVGDTAAKVVKDAKTVKPEDIGKNTLKMVSDAGAAINKHNAERKETQNNAKAVLKETKSTVPALTVHDAIVIVYLMMSADEKISAKEEQTFESIGKDMDPEYGSHRYNLVHECGNMVLDAVKSGEYSQSIHDQVAKTVWNSTNAGNGTINGKLMLWNLLAVSYADGVSCKEEQDIIRLVSRELKVAEDVLLEMEAAVKTTLAINREEELLKNSSKSYSTVEQQMNELEDRKWKIMQGIQALLTD